MGFDAAQYPWDTRGRKFRRRLQDRLNRNNGLLDRSLIPFGLLSIVIRDHNNYLWHRGDRVQQTSKVMSQLNLPPYVKNIGEGLPNGQDFLPLSNGPSDARNDAIFGVLDYLRMAIADSRRWSNL